MGEVVPAPFGSDRVFAGWMAVGLEGEEVERGFDFAEDGFEARSDDVYVPREAAMDLLDGCDTFCGDG